MTVEIDVPVAGVQEQDIVTVTCSVPSTSVLRTTRMRFR